MDGSGFWQVTGGAGNNLWFGRDDHPNSYHDDNPGQSHDILIGGALDDIINAGNGFDFIDGGAGNDHLYGADGNDILIGGKGNDALYGGTGNDSYVFNRGDGGDLVFDDAGLDTLVFGPGISVPDVSVHFGGAAGTDLIVDVRDPAHPGATLTDVVTLQGWADPNHRIETLVFADGTTLHVGDQFSAYRVPFGATLAGRSVPEDSATGTKVGTVAGFDLLDGAVLTYSLVNPDGHFAIDALTGVVTVTGLIDYEATTSHSQSITVRITDQGGQAFNQPFTIAVTEVPIIGSSGNDVITGTAFVDVIDGGAGNDILTGGAGNDTFIFRPGSGADTITDFAAGAGSDDSVDLTAYANTFALADVLARTTQHGADTVIDFGGGDSITLQNVVKASLSAGDFNGLQAFTYAGIWTPAGNGSDNTWHVGDFNGDGKDDIFRYLGGEDVFLSTGSSFAHSGVWTGAGNGSDNQWHVGDFNGDGKDDVFRFIDGSGDQSVPLQRLQLLLRRGLDPGRQRQRRHLACRRLQRRRQGGCLPLLAGSGEDVFLSNGSSFVHSAVWSPAGAGSDGKWYIGDFNGDDKDDFFRILDGSSGADMFLSNGSSFVHDGIWTPAGVGSDGTWHVGDFNGDGKSDLFRYIAGQSGADVFLSNGSTFVHDTAWTGAGIGDDNQWYVGDFNGGGADDIFRYLSGVGMFPSAFG